VGILVTTIAFLNFATQVRGYAPSILLTALLFSALLGFRERPKWLTALWVAALSGMLFYTIPSNIYLLVSCLGVFLVDGFLSHRSDKKEGFSIQKRAFIFINPSFTLAVMILAGVFGAGLLYIPILSKVVGNKFVESLGLFQGTVFIRAFPILISGLFSNREPLFLLALIGLLFGYVTKFRDSAPDSLFVIHLSFVAFAGPIVISFIRGDDPFERSFLIGIVPFILLAAFGLESILEWLKGIGSGPLQTPLWFLILALLYMNLVFLFQYRNIEIKVFQDLSEENIQAIEFQDNPMGASYYLDHYHVMPVVIAVSDKLVDSDSERVPVILDTRNTTQLWMMEAYLDIFEIPFQEMRDPENLQEGKAYVIVSYPQRSLEAFRAVFPETQCSLLTREVSIYQALNCQFLIAP
jgi:hypothetical protein